jgi:nucleoside 2-deoxyribosyltransferase
LYETGNVIGESKGIYNTNLKMKIYLAGAIAGGREFERGIRVIANILEELGHDVMTKRNVVENEIKNATHRTLNDRKKIMKRDKGWIKKCDAFIAEVSTYSHGVGYEHSYAESLGKPVLLLRHKSLKGKKYSAFLDGTGYKKFMFSFYDEKNIQNVLKKFITAFKKTTGKARG